MSLYYSLWTDWSLRCGPFYFALSCDLDLRVAFVPSYPGVDLHISQVTRPVTPSFTPLSLCPLTLPLSLQTVSRCFVIVCFLSPTHLSLLFSLSFLVFPLSVPNNNIAHSNLLYRQ